MKMAFLSRFGNLLKQSGSNHVNMGLSSSNSPLFQSIRSMSSAKLFVGGLAYATDEMGLKEAFQQYGEVIDVITDRDSGRSRGFGFVSYTSADAANSALQDMDGKELDGRRIRVSVAQERPRPSFGGGYGGPGGGGYGAGGGGGYGGAGGYMGGGYGGGNSNIGGYGGGNQNAGGRNDLFSGVLGGGGGDAGVSPGGNEGGGDENMNHFGEDDVQENDDDYANTCNK